VAILIFGCNKSFCQLKERMYLLDLRTFENKKYFIDNQWMEDQHTLKKVESDKNILLVNIFIDFFMHKTCQKFSQ
jgi:hypothetical protein